MKTMSKEYVILFNEITDACEELAELSNQMSKVGRRLMHAQQLAEEMYITDDYAD